jgi:hypothetical protein
MLRFHPSAARHGIARDRVVYVLAHAQAWLDRDDETILVLGPDQRGIPLEIVVIGLADGELLVIHAMRMRGSYKPLYRQVMRWQ